MKAAPKPKLSVALQLEIEMDYDPFQGRTPLNVVDLLQDKLVEMLMDSDPNIFGLFTTVISVNELNTEVLQ